VFFGPIMGYGTVQIIGVHGPLALSRPHGWEQARSQKCEIGGGGDESGWAAGRAPKARESRHRGSCMGLGRGVPFTMGEGLYIFKRLTLR